MSVSLWQSLHIPLWRVSKQAWKCAAYCGVLPGWTIARACVALWLRHEVRVRTGHWCPVALFKPLGLARQAASAECSKLLMQYMFQPSELALLRMNYRIEASLLCRVTIPVVSKLPFKLNFSKWELTWQCLQMWLMLHPRQHDLCWALLYRCSWWSLGSGNLCGHCQRHLYDMKI